MSLDATLARPPTGRSALGRARAHVAVPLFRNGYSLVASTLSTSLLGALFWTVAARRYPASSLGVDAALISAMTLIASLAHLNLTNALNRFVPSAGGVSARLISVSYAVAGGLATVAATVFVLGAHWWAPSLGDALGSRPIAVAFVAATVTWVIFELQDAALAGLGAGTTVLGENLGYAVAKIAILVAVAGGGAVHGVFTAWIAPLVPTVVIVNVYVFRRFVPAHAARQPAPIERPGLRTVGRFIAADYTASLLWTAATSVQPILVLGLVGPEAGAHAYMAWTISYSLYLVSVNMGMSLITEASRDRSRLATHLRGALTRTYWLLVPAVALTVGGAPLVLGIFGREYALEATTLLRLLALSALPYALVATFLAVARVQRRMRAVLVVNAAVSIPTLVLMLVMLPRWGIVAVGYAWLTSQLVVAVALLAGELRPLLLTTVDVGRLAARLRPLRSALTGPQRRPGPLERVPAPGRAARQRPVRFATSGHDVGVAFLEAAGGPGSVLRVSTSPIGARTLDRHRRALGAIAGLDLPERFRVLVPAVVETGQRGGRRWLVEERLGGRDGRIFIHHPRLPALLETAAASIGVLHGATAVAATVDEAMLERWVGEPLDRIAMLRRVPMRADGDRAAIERLCAELATRLAGTEVITAYTHGDYWLGNLLVATPPDRWRLSGIVDWDQAGLGRPGVLDVAHLLLTTRALRRREELGRTVVAFLGGETWTPQERDVLAASTAAAGALAEPRALVLVTWLHHIAANLRKAERYQRAQVWTAANVGRVLETV